MPNPIDLVGRRFGKLVVVARGQPQYSDSGHTKYVVWVCHCDCGRTESFRDHRLPYCKSNVDRRDVATECTHCRAQRTCVVCSKPFESHHFKHYCSDACSLVHRRKRDLEYYYQKVERDPSFNKKRAEEVRKRVAEDPEYAKRRAEWDARRLERKKELLRTDPDYKERTNSLYRSYYAEKSERILDRRKERLDERLAAMSPEEYEAWAERRRSYSRTYAANYRARPGNREKYNERMREYLRQQALRNLVSMGDELIKRSIDDDDDK